MMDPRLSDQEIDAAMQAAVPGENWNNWDDWNMDDWHHLMDAQLGKALWAMVRDMVKRFPGAEGQIDYWVITVHQYYHDKLIEMGIEPWEEPERG